MNCEKLNKDITKLQALRDKFARKVDELNDTMRGKIEVRKMQEEIQGLEDQILESYLVEFREKNPELFGWHLGGMIEGFGGVRDYNHFISSIVQLPNEEGVLVGGGKGALYECRKDTAGKWRLGEKISGFEDEYGSSRDIASIAQLPDGGMLMGGKLGTLYVCRKGADRKWGLGERIDGFEDKDGFSNNINSIAQLPDGEGMLVGGDSGTLYVCRKGEDEKWKLEDKIEWFNFPVDINCIAQLPDGEGMLVGGLWGELYVCRKDKDGKWKLGEKINGFESNGRARNVESIASLPDGEGMLVGGDSGALFICRKGEDGKWKLGEKIEGFKSKLGNRLDIYSIMPLPDKEGMLVGGSLGTLYVCRKSEDGKWKLEEKIEGFNNAVDYKFYIASIAQLPDKEGMLVGGAMGILYEASRSDLSVDTIKQNLDILIERSENGAE